MSSNLLPSGLSAHELRGHMDCLRATKPPYTCPISGCGRVYKSFSGIQSHLSKFKHDPSTSTRVDESTASAVTLVEARNEDGTTVASGNRSNQQLSWAQAQKIIDVDVGGKIVRLNTLEPIPLSFLQNGIEPPKDEKKQEMVPIPRAVFRELTEFEPTKMRTFPASYVRYIEKTAEELDEEIEYDMDEEDDAWLEIINDGRSQVGLPRVSEATFEFIMNRLEKVSYFKTAPGSTAGHDGDGLAGSAERDQDDDTVCCVCGDGECDNANAILFCDMCNLAVHQECYGVPYIPEGQWLCRRCQLSPSRGVECRLCPNKGGAFKQTADNGWAHVVCALWVPEVQFANTVFLEPIEGFDRIPPARWKLTCYICKQKSRGACIQCHKPSCYTAFHVTCAQQAGLYMKMETVHDSKSPDGGISVRKSAFCDIHTPAIGGADSADETGKKAGNNAERKSKLSEPSTSTPKFDMKRARKLLIQKRNLSPVVSVPVMPRRQLEQLNHQLRFANKQEFLDRILRYWTLKRRQRFGVPLLRRLQVTHHASRLEKERTRNKELQEQYNNWRQLRQDLEKARLLMELVRKRERKKKESLQVTTETWEKLLSETQRHMISTIDQLESIDDERVFTQPVNDDEVPGYSRIIKSPMDLSTMRKKVENSDYKDFAQLEKDFDLIMANCMKFNVQNEYYKSYGNRYKKKALEILRQAKESHSQIKDCRIETLAELQQSNVPGTSNRLEPEPLPATPEVEESTAATANKDVIPKPKPAPKTPKSKKGSTASFGDMPKLTAVEAQQQNKTGRRNSTSRSPSTIKNVKETTSAVPEEPASSSTTTKNKKAAQKSTPASSTKKSQPKGNKKMPATPATPRQPKKKQQKSTERPAKSTEKKSQNEDDEDIPLIAVVGQTPKESTPLETTKFITPAEAPGPSFRNFREDRKSPNSSAVESELEPASGDEADFLRRKAIPSASAVVHGGIGVEELDLVHLDFVWAHVQGRPWLPGVVIDPSFEYGPQSSIRFIPPPSVVNQRTNNSTLVMLFDEEKSWHWLKRDSMQLLGLDQNTDMNMLKDAGPAQAAVTQAYERAVEARNLVTGGDSFEDAEDEPPIMDEYRSSEDGSDSNNKRRPS